MDKVPGNLEWHIKEPGQKICPVCCCPNIRAGVRHRELSGQEYSAGLADGMPMNAYWVKRIRVSFGQDFSDEYIQI